MEHDPPSEESREARGEQPFPVWGGRSKTRLFLDLFFLLALLFSSAGYWFQPRCHPPYLDYDSATLGIFVNNLSFNKGYDDNFRGYKYSQHRYRTWWAAEFLPLSIPMSLLQRALGIPPRGVVDLLRVLGALFGLLGCLTAASLLRASEGWTWRDKLFFLGFLAAAPPYLLFIRTVVPHFMFTFLLFWVMVKWTADYCRTGNKGYLYFLGAGTACFAMVPYPPMFFLPLFFLLLVAWSGRLKETILDLNLFGAVLLGGVFFLTATFIIAWTQGEPYAHLMEKAYKFLQTRGGAVSFAKLDPSLLPDKLQKLFDQHILFLRDDLGDWSRDDALWTLGSVHLLWLAAFPVGLFGLFKGLKDKLASARVFASVLFASYAVALTFSFPEGRYLLPVVPCYAYFITLGLRSLLERFRWRWASATLFLLLFAGNTFILVKGPGYDGYMAELWKYRGGVREAIDYVLQNTKDPARYAIGVPYLDNEEYLYFEVYNNFRLTVFGRSQVIGFTLNKDKASDPEKAAEELSRILVLRDESDKKEVDFWKGFGFKIVHRFREPCTGKTYVLLCTGKFPSRKPG